jgi:hypothetical protein
MQLTKRRGEVVPDFGMTCIGDTIVEVILSRMFFASSSVSVPFGENAVALVPPWRSVQRLWIASFRSQ